MTTSEVPLAKGEPENPASGEDIYDKFVANASLAMPAEHARKMGDVILGIEKHRLSEFVGLL